MNPTNIILVVLALGLMAYLGVALFNPRKF